MYEFDEGWELRRPKKSKRVQLLVRPYVWKRIKEKADADGVSANEFVNRLFDAYLFLKDNK